MNMIKVSIIIPVYNVERYIARCLDSCINQTYENLEFVCVDDGSTDESLKILEQYKKLDKRVVIIHQANSGLSAARNTGMCNITGDYIFFLDADDYISNNAIECLVKHLEEVDSDVVIFDYLKDSKNPRQLNRVCINELSSLNGQTFNLKDLKSVKSFKNGFYQLTTFFVTAWCKIYKRSFLEQNKIEFIKGLYYEDVPFFLEILLKANKISYLPEMLLNYSCGRSDQIMAKNGEEFLDIFKVCEKSFELLKTSEYYDFLHGYYSMVMLFYCLNKLKGIKEDLKSICFEKCKVLQLDFSNFDKVDKSDFEQELLKEYEIIKSVSSYQEFLNAKRKAGLNVV